MTEAEWLACTDINTLVRLMRGQTSSRKLRLCACACCRSVWGRLSPEERRAVEAAERFADRQIGNKEREAARSACPGLWPLPRAVREALAPTRRIATAARSAAWLIAFFHTPAGRGHGADESTVTPLLREILGNPWRRPVVAPAWLAWNGGAVPKLAATIYDNHAFDRLPILADALEDAGCDNADLLTHLRGPGPHFRGCWALDLVLGKE
jgi:hypothetical protein